MSRSHASHDPYAALRHPAFRRFLTASVVGTVGAEMQLVAVGWELFERSGSKLALGLVGLVQAVPIIGLALPAGQVADRVPRKLLVMATHGLMALASLGLAVVSVNRAPIGLMYAALALTGLALAFAFPAR